MLSISDSLKKKINLLYTNLSYLSYFGRSDIIGVLNLSPSGASKFISRLLELKIIAPISNHGKGKYVFCINGD